MEPAAQPDARTSPCHRGVEISAIVAFFLLTALLAERVLANASAGKWFGIALGILVGFVAADFVSGMVHWIGDTWGDSSWPVLGPGLIRPFREHHVDPLAITRHDFVETNGNSSIGSVILLGLGLSLPPAGPLGTLLCAAVLSLASWLFATNQIHKWAHASNRPAPVDWLQKRRWILAPEHHGVHHSAPFDRYYCITTGWLNPVLTRFGFFPALERWIQRATGAMPRRQPLS